MLPLDEWPASQPPGAWQRMQVSPPMFASWLAMATAACHTGSRALCAMRLVAQVSYGAIWSPYPEWQ